MYSGHSLAIKFLYCLYSSYTTGMCTCIYVHDVIIICSVHTEESMCTASIDMWTQLTIIISQLIIKS